MLKIIFLKIKKKFFLKAISLLFCFFYYYLKIKSNKTQTHDNAKTVLIKFYLFIFSSYLFVLVAFSLIYRVAKKQFILKKNDV